MAGWLLLDQATPKSQTTPKSPGLTAAFAVAKRLPVLDLSNVGVCKDGW